LCYTPIAKVRISPLMYQHVIPNGTYHFARSKPGDVVV
jgi:hypothetical protein